MSPTTHPAGTPARMVASPVVFATRQPVSRSRPARASVLPRAAARMLAVGERLVEQWNHVNDLVDDGLLNDSLALTATTTSVPAAGGRHAYERTVHATVEGRTLVEYLLVPEMEHVWPGLDGEGFFTDQAGPDAAGIVTWRFAQGHDLGLPSP